MTSRNAERGILPALASLEGTFSVSTSTFSSGKLRMTRLNVLAVALQAFMQAAHVQLGQRLTAIVGGRAFTFTVVGAALSPEYVYVPAPESFMPDDAHQAVIWAPRPAVERAAGMTGAVFVRP